MEEQDKNIKTVKKKKGLSRWIRLIIYLVVIFVLIDVFLIFFATPVMKRYIQEKVKEKTDNLFSVEFSKISFELSTRRIALEDFNLIADTAVYNRFVRDSSAHAALYNIACKSVEIRGFSLYNTLINSRLKAKELKLTDPIVELKKLPNKEEKTTKNRDFVHKDLYPAISKYVNEIQIRRISLNNGKFLLNLHHKKNAATTHIGYLTVVLYDFLLNKEQFDKKENLFYSDDLQLQLSEYRVNLNDNIHIIYADTVKVSTKSSSLKIINAGVEPISKSKTFLKKIKQNYLQLKTPLAEFKGFNINQLYFDHDISIKQINIENPNIKVVKKTTTTKIDNKLYTPEKKIDLTRLLNENLKSIKIGTCRINNAQLKQYLHNWNSSPIYNAKSLNLRLNDFNLNEKSNNDYNKIFYSDSLQISIDTITGKLPDKVHTVMAKNIHVSTNKHLFTAKTISVKPLYKSKSQNNLNIYIPALTMRGTNYKQLYHKNILYISSLNISPSKFDIRLIKNKLKGTNNNDKKQAVAFKKLLFINIIIKNLQIANSRFNIQKAITDSTEQNFTGKIQLLTKGFTLNKSILSNNKSKLLIADKFDINLSDYKQDLNDLQHILEVKSLQISNIDSLIALSGAKLYKKDFENKKNWHTSKRIYNVDVGKAYAKGIDIYRMLGDKELVAKHIKAQKPSINIYNNISKKARANYDTKQDSVITFRKLLQKQFNLLNINELELNEANIKIADFDSLNNETISLQTQLNLHVNNFNFVSNTEAENHISYSDDIKFSLNNFVSKALGKNYQLKIKKVGFSSKDSVFKAGIIRLFPDSIYEHSKSTEQFFTIYMPFAQSKSISIKELLDNNIINLGKLRITNPVFSLSKKHFAKNLKKQAKQNKKSKFQHIIAGKIDIINGVFGIIHHSKGKEELLTSTTFNMEINNLDFDSTAMQNPKDFISKLDLNITLQNAKHKTFKTNNLFNLDYCRFNNKYKELTANNIQFKTANNSVNKKLVIKELGINNLKLNKFELSELIVNKSLIINKLHINKPNLTVVTHKSKFQTNKNNISNLNLYKKIRNTLNSVNINNIKTDSLKLELVSQKGFYISKTLYNHIDADISGLLIDSIHQNDNRLLNADDVTILLRNYSTNLDNGIYNLYVKDLGVSTGRKSIFANSLSINPNFSRKEYRKNLQKEFSLNYLFTKNIEVQNVDLTKLLNTKDFIADKIIIDELKLHNYKDKKYPLDPILKIALPLDLVWDSKHSISIDSIKINNSYIGHDIMMPDSKQSGFLDFTKVNANIINLTNIDSITKQKPFTKLEANAYFMGESLLNTSFEFPIFSKIGEYRYTGNLKAFNMQSLNPYLENAAFVSIKSGTVDSLSFDIIANDEYATGNLTMFYNKLKLKLINKKKSDSLNVEKRGLFSMVANSIVRNRNRRLQPNSAIYFERNIYKSIFNYWALSVLNGVKHSLGFKSKQLKLRLKEERMFFKSQMAHLKRMKRWNKRKNRKK